MAGCHVGGFSSLRTFRVFSFAKRGSLPGPPRLLNGKRNPPFLQPRRRALKSSSFWGQLSVKASFLPLFLQNIRCVNQIEDVCRDIEKTINQTIQTTLNQLERDCDEIGAMVDSAIDGDNAARAHNLRAGGKGFLLLFLGCILPLAMVVNFFASSLSDQLLKDLLGKDGMATLKMYLVR